MNLVKSLALQRTIDDILKLSAAEGLIKQNFDGRFARITASIKVAE